VVAELLGWFGAGLSCVISLPQVVRTIHAKQLDGISSATYWLVLANAAAWIAWSLLTGEYAAGVPALVNGPVAIVILHRIVATRHTARRRECDTEVSRKPARPITDIRRQSPIHQIEAAMPHLTGRASLGDHRAQKRVSAGQTRRNSNSGSRCDRPATVSSACTEPAGRSHMPASSEAWNPAVPQTDRQARRHGRAL
jgi:uncharacterized protein with PQ loop repeat